MPSRPRVMVWIESSRAYERALLRGIARYSQLHGPWLFLREAPFWERRAHPARLAQLQGVDGLIMRESPHVAAIRRLGIPTVVSNYATETIAGLPNIVSDHEAIGRLAAEHLLERGFRHFGFCGYGGLFWSARRGRGFEQRLRQAGFRVDWYRPPPSPERITWRQEQPAVTAWLRAQPQPLGVLACIDERSQQVAEACQAAGLAVPDQVAILGVDNDEMICTLANVPLSSVAIAAEQGGYAAAHVLDRLMQGRRGPRRITIRPLHVVTRTSTDLVAVADPHVSRAVRFINDHCRQALYVAEVAKAAGLSRRVLEKRFRGLLHCSINDHIRQRRVGLIRNLLTETSLPISEIALSMGFPDAVHIARYFRRQTDTSPAAYRRRHRP